MSPCGTCGVDFTHVTSTLRLSASYGLAQIDDFSSRTPRKEFVLKGTVPASRRYPTGNAHKEWKYKVKRENNATELLKFFKHREYHESKSKGKPNRNETKKIKKADKNRGTTRLETGDNKS